MFMPRTTTDRVIPFTIGLPLTCLNELDDVLQTINTRIEAGGNKIKPISRSAYCSYILTACFRSKILNVVLKQISHFSPTAINELDAAFEPDLFGDLDKVIDDVDAGLVANLRPKKRSKKT